VFMNAYTTYPAQPSSLALMSVQQSHLFDTGKERVPVGSGYLAVILS
jgi:hypothetical protein